jgi:hypothetical protein
MILSSFQLFIFEMIKKIIYCLFSTKQLHFHCSQPWDSLDFPARNSHLIIFCGSYLSWFSLSKVCIFHHHFFWYHFVLTLVPKACQQPRQTIV